METTPMAAKKPHCVLMPIDSDLASVWLEKAGDGHRSISKPKVERLVRDIAAGNWRVTPNAIGFDRNGKLIDGRHRLSAIQRSGRGVESFVAFDLEPETAVEVTDDTRPRSLGDQFKMKGEALSEILGPCISHIWRYDLGLWGKSGGYPTKPEAKRFLDANPSIRESVETASKVENLISRALFGAAHFIFSRISPEEANEFAQRLHSGAGLAENDPILELRDKLKQNAGALRKLSSAEQFAIVIITWNLYRKGKPAYKQLRWIARGERKHPFPVAE